MIDRMGELTQRFSNYLVQNLTNKNNSNVILSKVFPSEEHKEVVDTIIKLIEAEVGTIEWDTSIGHGLSELVPQLDLSQQTLSQQQEEDQLKKYKKFEDYVSKIVKFWQCPLVMKLYQCHFMQQCETYPESSAIPFIENFISYYLTYKYYKEQQQQQQHNEEVEMKEVIFATEYIPPFEHILAVRIRTTGITELQFKYNSNQVFNYEEELNQLEQKSKLNHQQQIQQKYKKLKQFRFSTTAKVLISEEEQQQQQQKYSTIINSYYNTITQAISVTNSSNDSHNNNNFTIVDVGGARNERKKWIHCFEGVTALIHTINLDSFDLVLYEDNSTNRFVESIILLSELYSSRWFTNKPQYLILTNIEYMADKLITMYENNSITVYKFPTTSSVKFEDFHIPCRDKVNEAKINYRYNSSVVPFSTKSYIVMEFCKHLVKLFYRYIQGDSSSNTSSNKPLVVMACSLLNPHAAKHLISDIVRYEAMGIFNSESSNGYLQRVMDSNIITSEYRVKMSETKEQPAVEDSSQVFLFDYTNFSTSMNNTIFTSNNKRIFKCDIVIVCATESHHNNNNQE